MVEIRRLCESDAEQVAQLIRRNFLEVNSADYPRAEIQRLVLVYSPAKVRQIAKDARFYVACISGEIIGCGAIASFWGREDESLLQTIFVKPEWHGRGIGRRIVQTLENDPFARRAKRIEVHASITACRFYKKMGYQYMNGVKETDADGLYHMEKVRPD